MDGGQIVPFVTSLCRSLNLERHILAKIEGICYNGCIRGAWRKNEMIVFCKIIGSLGVFDAEVEAAGG
jgi:hypothetical protein